LCIQPSDHGFAHVCLGAPPGSAGTGTGLLAAAAIPYLQFTRRQDVDERSALDGWLLPVVPPMVSASTGALLVPYAAAGQVRLTLLLCCYAMFGLSLIASFVVIKLIWHRLAVRRVGPTPAGTRVTGTTGLALHTGATMFHWAAVACYAGLLAAWIIVAVRTANGSIRGGLFLPAAPPVANPADS
jgi:tellurite resistance protein TehA-like permease